MNKIEVERVEELHNIVEGSKHYEFSCHLCKLVARPADCQGCPVYCQSFSAD